MCGIVGYVGNRNAQQVLIGGLRRLEYRGYDCLSPDTLVQLEDGRIKTIQEIEAGSLLSAINLQDLHFSKGAVGLKGVKEKRSLYKIRTSAFEIESSRDHRFFVYKNGKILEKRAFELRPGDFLMSSRKIEIEGAPQELPKLQDVIYYQLTASGVKIIQQIRKTKNFSYNSIERKTGIHHQYAKDYLEGRRATQRHNWTRLFKLLKVNPSFLKTKSSTKVCSHSFQNNFECLHLNPSLSQIIGYILGDGSRLSSKIDRKIKLEDDFQTLKIYQDLFRKINIDTKLLKHRHKNCWQVRIYSAAFGKLLNKIAPGVLNNSSKREVPEIIMKSPPSCVAGFLRGFFDAEGSVGKRKKDGISLFSTSKKLLKQLQLLLLRCGIICIPSKEFDDIAIWDYDNLKTFFQDIGFSSPKKDKGLKDLLILRSGKRKGQLISSTPLTYKDLKKRMPLANVDSSSSFVSTYVLKRILHRVKGEYRESSNFIRNYFLNPYIFWTRIKTIERRHSKHLMFDLSIPTTQNFIANGLVVHNSAGIAVLNDKIGSRRSSPLQIKKRAGKLSALEAVLARRPVKGKLGISHVRWATHGVPSMQNAHPHWDCRGRIALVHNGIIENYEQLKESLIKEGHKFRSQTDTEVLVHLVEKFYHGSLEEAVRQALKKVRGTYAIAVISKDEPQKLVGARLGSPLIASASHGEGFLASDIPALLEYTNEFILLNDAEYAVIQPGSVEVHNLKRGEPLRREKIKVDWDVRQAEKEGFAHFMLKEIYEQPKALRNTLMGRISDGEDDIILPELKDLEHFFSLMEKIIIISCGTAWHAGLVAKYILEEYARIPVEVDISSEFRYRNPIINERTLVLAITQSGETADTLAGVRLARERGARVLSICNVLGSSIPRESDAVLYTHAGPEIAVASTKAYTSQLAVLYLFTFYLAKLKNNWSGRELKPFLATLEGIPEKLEEFLNDKQAKRVIRECARRYFRSFGFLYLGRSVNFPSALEGALKIKEISYMHAEGYSAGEMKHGPIALINPHLPVVCIAPESHVHEKMLSNIQEIKARKGIVISVANRVDRLIVSYSNHVIHIPQTRDLFSPFLTVVPLQLLAYYIAAKRGCDIDQPKNLAKSVTVE